MGVYNKMRLWLGWGPMILAGESEVRAFDNETKSAVPPSAPSGTLQFKRMDYYRNQILAMNAFVSLMMVNFSIYFYFNMWQDAMNNALRPLLIGLIIGFGYGIYETLNYRKKLFKEGRLTLGHKKPKSHRYWIIYLFFKFSFLIVVGFGLTYFFASDGFFLGILGFALPLILIQWLWYYDIKRWEKKQNQVFIWKPQGWYQKVIIETQNVSQ